MYAPAILSILILHAFATLAMTGLIWFVQIVHYPLMSLVGPAQFTEYERRHTSRTGAVVGPLMLAEAVTAGVLLFLTSATSARLLAWAGVALIVILWLSTAFVQVPCHRRLQAGFDATVHKRLVATNWVRTIAWSARAPIAIALLIGATS